MTGPDGTLDPSAHDADAAERGPRTKRKSKVVDTILNALQDGNAAAAI